MSGEPKYQARCHKVGEQNLPMQMQMIKTWLPVVTGMLCFGLGVGLMAVYGFFVAPLSQEFGVGVAVLNIGPVANESVLLR